MAADKAKGLPKDLTFEKALERLEAIVSEMESGRMPLDDALARFEEGSVLAAFCSGKLEDAERKIEVLVKKTDGTVERGPFEEGAEALEPPEPAPDDENALF